MRLQERRHTARWLTCQRPILVNILLKLREIKEEGGWTFAMPLSSCTTSVEMDLDGAGNWVANGGPEPQASSWSRSRRLATILQGSQLGYKSLAAQ